MERVDVCVVGGGIAGLSAAYELHRLGVAFRLFEATDHLGGVILTESLDGFTIDGGPDALLAQKPAAIELCRELGLGDRLQPTLEPRTAYILKQGRLHPLPEASVLGIPTRLAPFARTGLFSAWAKLRFGLDLALPPCRLPPSGDESIGAFFRRRFGPEAVDYLAEPLLATIHAGDVDRLSMRALFPRLLEAEQAGGSLIQTFRRRRTPAPPDGMFRSLPGGLAELTAALVATLPTERVSRNARVETVDQGADAPFIVRTADSVCSASAVILAAPAPVAAGLLGPRNERLAALCREIPHASTATVALTYPRDAVTHPLRGSGFVVPRVEPDVSIIAATWVSSKWPGRAPADQVLLRAFIGGARDPEVLDRTPDDTALAQLAHTDLARILGIAVAPSLARVYRWMGRSPQHEVGHLDRLDAIERRLEETPGLFLTGSSFRSVGIPDCVRDGRATARRAVERTSGAAAAGESEG